MNEDWSSEKQGIQKSGLKSSIKKTGRAFVNVLPVMTGMLLLTALAVTVFPEQVSANLFGRSEMLDALIGGSIGSVAVGHPLASYLLGGELVSAGISTTAVTALIVSWVTVGIVQLPAEALMLGTRFAVYRAVICFLFAIAIAFLVKYTMWFIG